MIDKVCNYLNSLTEAKFFKPKGGFIHLRDDKTYANSMLTLELWDVLKKIDETNYGYVRLNYGNTQIQIGCRDWYMLASELGVKSTYTIGDKFDSSLNKRYILAQVDCSIVTLINLNSGHRLSKPVEVKNIYNITESEMNELSGNITVRKVESYETN